MIILKGKGVSDGIAIGRLLFYERQITEVQKREVSDTAYEYGRFESARIQAIQALDVLYKKAVDEIGQNEAMVFETHKMILADEDFIGNVKMLIETECVNAEYALEQTNHMFYEIFATMEDEYMRARAMDIKLS